MKKLTILLAVALIATIGISSCNKNPLVGTIWVEYGGQAQMQFSTATNCMMVVTSSSESESAPGIYTYKKPNITITLTPPGDPSFTVTGTVIGDQMTLSASGGETMIFTKQ